MTTLSAAQTAESTAVAAPQVETLAAQATRTTPAGHGFTAPAGFRLTRQANVLRVQPPEDDLTIAIVDLDTARDADDALAQGWAAYRPEGASRPLKIANPLPPRAWHRAANSALPTTG